MRELAEGDLVLPRCHRMCILSDDVVRHNRYNLLDSKESKQQIKRIIIMKKLFVFVDNTWFASTSTKEVIVLGIPCIECEYEDIALNGAPSWYHHEQPVLIPLSRVNKFSFDKFDNL